MSGAALPFGAEAAGYDRARPDYPAALYEALIERLSLRPGLTGLEIGAGTGLASRALSRRGFDLVAVEPDPLMAAELARHLPHLQVIAAPLETADLPAQRFDFAVSAMAMHWLSPEVALPKIRAALRPGAGFGMWWTIFGDPVAPDAFQRAASPVFAAHGVSQGQGSRPGAPPYALRTAERLADLSRAGFAQARVARFDWSLRQSTAQVLALTRTFSPVLRMSAPARAGFLHDLAALCDGQFGGQIERQFVSLLYTARRGRD